MAGAMPLTVEDLSCRRAGRLVFAGLSFVLGEGEARLLRGPNGAGKSSLLRVLAGLVPADGGRIALDGVAPAAADAWAERVAYAGHLDAIKPQLTVAENLRFWAALHGAAGIGPALDSFALAEIAGRPAHACSAGQKRRLGLARLMLARRRLWLLDEPTVALDRAAIDRLLAVLGDHLAGGGMALVATHVDLALPSGPPVVLESRLGQRGRAVADADDPFLAGSFA
jgi:heme exporter protein A